MHHHGEHHAEHTDARTEAPGPLRPDYSGQGAAASQASAMPRHPIDHADHDKHAGHSVAMFRRKFSIPLVLTLPTLVWDTCCKDGEPSRRLGREAAQLFFN